MWLMLVFAAACSADTSTPRTLAGQRGANASVPAPATSASGITTAAMAAAPVPRMPEAPAPECTNLQCRQTTCPSGGVTTVSGAVFDPAGKNPLYNVVVYVPNEAVQALPQGATCDRCDALYSGKPIAAALTDASGRFTLEHAPEGANVPLVIQVGKWRKQLTIPMVTACSDNPLPDGMLRLPRNRMEGDIPRIAISTGMADTLECLLRRVGIDASEYVPGPGGDARIHIFQGNPQTRNGRPSDCKTIPPSGAGGTTGGSSSRPADGCPAPNTAPPAPRSSQALWSSKEELMKYDVVLLSCEGEETDEMNQQALQEYASAGGRVFASHYHYAWFSTGPYATENLADWSTAGSNLGDIHGSIVTTLADGSPFPKGMAMLQWLQTVNALTNGKLPIEDARHHADVNASHAASQPWIIADADAREPGATQYFSFNTPTNPVPTAGGEPMACGRVVFSDLHVGAASGDTPLMPIPTSCNDADLSPQEKALEFMLFDLSSCVTPDRVPPGPPILQ
jgi:hypothetical protein